MSNGRFAISIHILTLLAKIKEGNNMESEWVPSDYIAGSININPVLVRKEISNLRNADLVISKEGKNGGSSLGKPADQILLSDVYKTVFDEPILKYSKNEPNTKCPIGKQINEHLEELFKTAEDAMLDKLGCTSLQQFCDKFN